MHGIEELTRSLTGVTGVVTPGCHPNRMTSDQAAFRARLPSASEAPAALEDSPVFESSRPNDFPE